MTTTAATTTTTTTTTSASTLPTSPSPSSGTGAAPITHTVSSSPAHGLKPPGKLNTSGNLADAWKSYKQVWENYSLISGLNSQTEEYRVAFFLHCIGTEGLTIYNGFQFENETDRKILQKVLEKFDEFTLGQTNETYERYVFNSRNQGEQESIDAYVTVLRNLAKSCNFCDCMRDSLIRDRIVLGVNNNAIRKKLLQVRGLTLNQCIDTCRSNEATTSQMKAISGSDAVHKIGEGKKQGRKPPMEKMIGMCRRNRLANLRRNVYSVEACTCYRKINVLLGDRNAPDVAVETTLKVSARNPNHAKFTGSLKCLKNPHQKRARSSFSLELL